MNTLHKNLTQMQSTYWQMLFQAIVLQQLHCWFTSFYSRDN